MNTVGMVQTLSRWVLVVSTNLVGRLELGLARWGWRSENGKTQSGVVDGYWRLKRVPYSCVSWC